MLFYTSFHPSLFHAFPDEIAVQYPFMRAEPFDPVHSF
ncbi:hypothetical protein BSM4216_2425 [Bacillus smithii]|nr:hypothetical protein BSM4216_2425 [Bacillus smithii]